MYVHMINQTSRRLNKAKQSKSTRLRKSFFPEKNWLPQVGFELMTLCSLDRGSSVDVGRISYTNTEQGKANHLNLYMNIHVRSILYTCIQRGYKMFAHYTSICTLPVVTLLYIVNVWLMCTCECVWSIV